MNDRLLQFLAAENVSQAQFADTIGVARASVSHIIGGRNKPGFDFIKGMAEHYPNLNIEWLIAGRGRMYKNTSGRESTDEMAAKPQAEIPAKANVPDEPEEAVNLFEGDETFSGEGTAARQVASPEKQWPREAKKTVIEPQKIDTQRKVEHIIVLYDDGTYSLLQ